MRRATNGARRARRALLALLPPAALAALAAHTGWLSARRPWPQTTGWDRAGAPPPRDRFAMGAAGELRLAWLGHSGFLLDWQGTRLLVDPNLSRRCTIARRELPGGPSPRDLGAVDAALISHAHFDHLDLPTLRAVSRLPRLLLPVGAERYADDLAAAGVAVEGLRAGDRRRIGALEVVAVRAAHNGNRSHPFRGRAGALGWVVRAGEEAIYLAGDTSAALDFAALRRAFHLRLAVLPIGAFAPRLPLRWYHLSPEEAAAAAQELGAEVVVPCHFGTFTLSLDRPSTALPRFAAAARRAGVRWAMPALLGDA